MSLQARVKKGVAWNAASQFGGNVLQLGVTMVLARLLGPEPFGALAIFLVIVGYARILCDMGLTASLIQADTLDDADVPTAFWFNNAVGTVLALGFYAGAAPIAEWYGMPDLLELVHTAAVVVWLISIGLVQRAMLSRDMRFKRMAIIDLVAIVAGGASAVVLALLGEEQLALPALYLVRSVVTAAGLWAGSVTSVRGWPTWIRLRGMAQFSGLVALNSWLGYFSDNLDRLLLGRAVSATNLAIFDQGMRYTRVPVDSVVAVVGRVAFPALSKMQQQPQKLAAAWERGVGLTFVATLPAALGGRSDPATRLISLSFEDESAVPLGNEPVLAGGRIIGKTTSAAFGYRVGRPVAIALVESGAIIDGGAVELNIGGEIVAAGMSVAPLFDPSGARMRQPQLVQAKSKVM